MPLHGFIFDLDGVLTDTAAYHYQAWQRLADELGIPFDRVPGVHTEYRAHDRVPGVGRPPLVYAGVARRGWLCEAGFSRSRVPPTFHYCSLQASQRPPPRNPRQNRLCCNWLQVFIITITY